ncbi:effector-associated domain EAD1-containing protein [Frankia sp. R43]|uniref:effector-associated domain EAD1-containing protein n=1 Tax=Frankia sp. R43 TaxID=269536 RepID=UPI00128FBBF4|nr:effector-associated domain EAD1-containing protein [Frankia sp. R43]
MGIEYPHRDGERSPQINVGDIENFDNRDGFFGISFYGDLGNGVNRHSGPANRSHVSPNENATGVDSEAARATSGNPGIFTELEIEALAKIYRDPQSAREVLARAGLPVQRLPAWSDSLSFWRRVGELVGHGVVANGRRKILSAACFDFPANSILATALRSENMNESW